MRCEVCLRARPLTYHGLGYRSICADCIRDLESEFSENEPTELYDQELDTEASKPPSTET